MNKFCGIGNLVRDPENRTTANGISVCSFTIAINRKFKDADGKQQADFISVVAWRQLADLCGRYIHKGSKVGVVGSLQSRSYEDKNGNKRTAYEVAASEIEFLTPKGSNGYSDNQNVPQGEYGDVSGYGDDDDDDLPF